MNPSTREETFMRGISNVLQGEDSGVSIAPSSRTEYFLNEILEAASGGGGGGGGDLLIVKITEDENTGDLMADKNYNEISAAISSGLPVIGVAIYQDTEIVCNTVVADNSGAAFTGYFSEVSGSSLNLSVNKYVLAKGTSYNVTYSENTFTIS